MAWRTPSLMTDRKYLGMDKPITRRDFMEGSLIGAAGLALPSISGNVSANPLGPQYPPSLTGLRGSHDGSFETAHALALEGKTNWPAPTAPDTGEYDLVVVGAGVSGLSAAWFYKARYPDARILIIENHDDFGGHAKRNEFDVGGRHIIGYGGSQSLVAPSAYSEVATGLLSELGVTSEALGATYDLEFYKKHNLAASIYFDQATFGVDKTIRTDFLDASGFVPLSQAGLSAAETVPLMPIADEAKQEMLRLIEGSTDKLPNHSFWSEPEFLASISYDEFIKKYLGVTHPDVGKVLRNTTGSYFGHGTDVTPAMYALGFGLPGIKSTSLGIFSGLINKFIEWTSEPYIYHFPDGNASVARLLVRSLMPEVAPGNSMQDVVLSDFDYSKLDVADSQVRLRLSSTVINVAHTDSHDAVDVQYMRAGQNHTVRAKQVVMACYNMAIPHLCPELPGEQKAALKKLVKIPLVYTNVVLNNWRALKKLGVGFAYAPGSWHQMAMVDFPVSFDDYAFSANEDEPIVLHLNRTFQNDGGDADEQSKVGRYELLGTSFDAIEEATRSQLAGWLSEGGFDPAADIAGITVNRWPHGYAWSQDLYTGTPMSPADIPNVIGRKRHGRITIANSDAGARAYLDCAIDEAWRAVNELEQI